MAVSIKQALELIKSKVKRVDGFEILPIEKSLGRVAYEDLKAIYPLPRFNNSAMDGYGVKFDSDIELLDIVETIFAGDNKSIEIKKSQAIKIMTGARVPSSVDVIIPKELTNPISNTQVKIDRENLKLNQHIRFLGEDVAIDEIILSKGEKINSSHIALLASQGVSHIKVNRKIKVAIFATGEELKLHYEKIEPHQIYNSNTPTLIARVEELGCEALFLGVAKDNLEDIKRVIELSLNSDLVITSGGVSVGDADFTKEAFESFGMIKFFDKIDIKPGKPTLFGKINNTFILNLPGNPLAAMSIFEIFGRTLINSLAGLNRSYFDYIPLPLSTALKQKIGKYSVVVGHMDRYGFTPAAKRSPGMVSVLRKCNAFILTNNRVEFLEKGTIVKVIPFYEDIFSSESVDIFTIISK
jgi:molybdopterin molybdotransferase